MKNVSLNGLAQVAWMLSVLVLLTAAAVMLVGLVNNYQVRVSPKHQDAWIGVGDLVVLTDNNLNIGDSVVVKGLQLTQDESIARITMIDIQTNRIEVVDDQGQRRLVTNERILGEVQGVMSGLGKWLQWLSVLSHVMIGVVLPLLSLMGLELQSLARQWHAVKRYTAA